MAEIVENYVEVLAADVDEVEEVAYGGVTGERYEKCCVCGVFYPRSQMEYFEGRWYSFDFGCNEDIRGIIENRIANRLRMKERPKTDRGGR